MAAAPDITLWHSPGTRSSRVAWLLLELGLPFQANTDFHLKVGSQQSELQSAEYRAVQPLGQMPALRDGDITIWESCAIVQYLLTKYGEGRLQPAPGSPQYAYFLQWLWFAEASLGVFVTGTLLHSVVRPEAARVPQILPEYRERVRQALAVLDKELSGKEWVVGDAFTAADIVLAHPLLKAAKLGMLEPFPNTVAYVERLKKRPACKESGYL